MTLPLVFSMRFRWQRGWGGNRQSLPYLVFFLSLAATACAWVWAGLIVGTQDSDRFRAATEEAETAIRGRIDDQEDLLRACAATYAVRKGWTSAQFRVFVDNLRSSESFRGSQGLGFVKRIKSQEVPALEKQQRQEGQPGFTVRPFHAGEDLFPILYLEPSTDTNVSALGFDVFSDPLRREALISARDLGEPIMSGLVDVAGSRAVGSAPPSLILFCPLYDGDDFPDTSVQRRAELAGFVFSRFRGRDIFHDVLEGQARRDLDIEIFEVYQGRPPVRFYTSSRYVGQRRSRIVFDGQIPVAGRQWMVRYHSSQEFEQQSASWLVNWIPIVGILVSSLLGAVSLSQVRAYRQLDSQAATVVRREAHQRLLANIGALLVDSTVEQNLNTVCKLVVEQFADWFAVCLVDRSQGVGKLVSVWREDPPSGGESEDSFRTSLLKAVFEITTPTAFEFANSQDTGFKPLRDAGIKALAVIPMFDHHGLIGAVVGGRANTGFDGDDMRLLEQIATRTSLAIEGIRLFREKEIELEERRKAEAQVRRLNENLEHIVQERTTELQATNKELEAFCYSVSHDLRAPLRSVDGFSKSLLEDYGGQLDEQAIDYISRVRNASHRMDELISALLNLSRITRLEIVRQHVDVSQMAALTVEDALEGRDRDQFEVTVQPGMVAEADPKLLRVVFDNLVRNAVKFSGRSKKSKIEIGLDKDGFFVRDSGVGFNPAYAEKLFVAFERLHTQSEFPGSGIGLATVFRIIQKHGGNVWAQSEEGKGAVFYFTLR